MSIAFEIPGPLREILVHFAEVVCPPGLIKHNRMQRLMDEISLYLGAMPVHLRAGLLAGFAAFDQGARFFPKSRGQRFTRLSFETRDAYFTALAHGPTQVQRSILKLMKAVITFNYYELPDVKKELEYHPDQYIREVAERRLRSYTEAIIKGEEAVFADDPLDRKPNLVPLRRGPGAPGGAAKPANDSTRGGQ